MNWCEDCLAGRIIYQIFVAMMKMAQQRQCIKIQKHILKKMGYSCELNYPYSGALVSDGIYHVKTRRYIQMLEINRRV